MVSEWHAIIHAGSEDRNREYKKSFPWSRSTDGDTMAKVTKTILAMSNLRDGGHIVIGVEEGADGTFRSTGMKGDDWRSYSYDVVADFVTKYADPYAALDVHKAEIGGRRFVVISVVGFGGVPVLCKQSYGQNILAEGALYIRPRGGRPRTAPISSYVDMREILDVAVEKGVRKYLETVERASPSGSRDGELFDEEEERFRAGAEGIRKRGHWHVALRPRSHTAERIASLGECREITLRSQVRYLGREFPYADVSSIANGRDYVQSEVDLPWGSEVWRFHQSGQFLFTGGLTEDWRERNCLLSEEERSRFPPGEVLSVLSTLYRLSEIYEFTARLAQAGVFGEQVTIRVELVNVEGRRLRFLGQPDRAIGQNCVCIEPCLSREVFCSAAELIADAKERALEHFLWITERFQCRFSEHVFRRDQERFFEGKY